MEGKQSYSRDQLELDFEDPVIFDEVKLVTAQSLLEPFVKASKYISSIIF